MRSNSRPAGPLRSDGASPSDSGKSVMTINGAAGLAVGATSGSTQPNSGAPLPKRQSMNASSVAGSGTSGSGSESAG